MNLTSTYVSPSVEKMLGFTPAERMAQTIDQQLTPPSQQLIFEALMAELEREKDKDADPNRSMTLELEYYHKDGSIRHHEVYVRGIRDKEGNLTGFYGSHHDITERKQTAEALRQATDRLKLAARAGGVGIWDYDVVHNILTWDDEMFRLYGITKDKFSGAYEAWQAGLHPEDRLRGDEEIQQALRGEKDFDTEFRVV